MIPKFYSIYLQKTIQKAPARSMTCSDLHFRQSANLNPPTFKAVVVSAHATVMPAALQVSTWCPHGIAALLFFTCHVRNDFPAVIETLFLGEASVDGTCSRMKSKK